MDGCEILRQFIGSLSHYSWVFNHPFGAGFRWPIRSILWDSLRGYLADPSSLSQKLLGHDMSNL